MAIDYEKLRAEKNGHLSVIEKDGHAVVVDHNGKSIVDIVEEFDEELGAKVLTPVFSPETARRIARAINGQEITLRLVVDASGAIHVS